MSNSQKVNFQQSLNQAAINRAADAIQLLGKALPASVVSINGAIVTVKFEVLTERPKYNLPHVTIPLFGSEYVRLPIHAGCKGIVLPADAFIGNMSGLGIGTPDLTQPANLSALVFLPIGNSGWSTVDPNAVTVYGPNGVVMRDSANQSSVVVLPGSVMITGRDSITMITGAATISMTSAGVITVNGTALTLHGGTGVTISDSVHSTNLVTMNTVFAAFVAFTNGHVHPDPVSGNTGAPTTTFTGNIVS